MREPGPATRVGRFQLVSPIGAGGMGRVWVALDTAAPTLRLVALKTALAQGDVGANHEFWAMLSDEAALASRITHPNVCATYELGFEANIHFLVMEWSDGASLRDMLDAAPGRRIAPELAAFIGASVAAGLHAAHELSDEEGNPLGVVHRDVSPQNVLVSMHGHVRLADFGVAKARGQQHRPTETGEVKGKLSYMAPEQVTSKDIDRRADVFALGCVLYEATLGVRPFHGSDALATMYKILEEDLVAPRQLDPNFPEELEKVLLLALAKNRDARYATAEELRTGLLDYLASTRQYVADKHVAELLGGALGEKLKSRNRAIMTSAEQLRRGETDPSRLESPPPPVATKTLTPEGGIERSVTFAKPKPSSQRTALAVVGGVALVLVVLATRSFWAQQSADPLPSPVTAASPAVQLPAASSTAEPVAPTPPSVTASSAPSASVVPAVVEEPPRGPVRPRLRPRPVEKPPVVEAVVQPPPQPQPQPLPTPPRKKPRPIDHSNPFGNPEQP